MKNAWVQEILIRSELLKIPFFFKQWGMHRPIDQAPPPDYQNDTFDPKARILRFKGELFDVFDRKKEAGKTLNDVEYNMMPWAFLEGELCQGI